MRKRIEALLRFTRRNEEHPRHLPRGDPCHAPVTKALRIIMNQKKSEIMLLEKEYFDIWMRRIMERLEAIERRQKPPKAQEYPTLENGEKLFDNYDLCRMLHVSKRTLQRYRTECGLKYRMLNQKAFYKESDVQEFIRDNFAMFARRREDQRP